jgi:SAM-dependent methyltransferase
MPAVLSELPLRIRAARSGLIVPPLSGRLMIGGGDFFAGGEEFLRYFIEFGGLKPDEDVLDVGSGYGRMALPLNRYLSGKARYEGFDVLAEGVRWCQRHITPKHPNFGFQVADLYNGLYNRTGRYKTVEYRFPYEDASFDFVFLTSVYTHLMPADLEHYVSEVSRVLRPDGRVLATYFLLNEDVRQRITSGESRIRFSRELEGCLVPDKGPSEAAVGYDENVIRALNSKYGLTIQEPIRYGLWSGVPSEFTFQDIVVAVKQENS